jgi:hypothetical protein
MKLGKPFFLTRFCLLRDYDERMSPLAVLMDDISFDEI